MQKELISIHVIYILECLLALWHIHSNGISSLRYKIFREIDIQNTDKIVAAMEWHRIDNLFDLQQYSVVDSFRQKTDTIYNNILVYNIIVLFIRLFLFGINKLNGLH